MTAAVVTISLLVAFGILGTWANHLKGHESCRPSDDPEELRKRMKGGRHV